jgi:hypothetical protein
MAFLWRLYSVVRIQGPHLVHTSEYPKVSIIVTALPLLTESCTANCRHVKGRSTWIMSLACCNMSGLVAVAGHPDSGQSRSSISPLPEASIQRCSYRLYNFHTQHTTVYECSQHFLSPPLRIQLQLTVCNVCQTQTPFLQTTTVVEALHY